MRPIDLKEELIQILLFIALKLASILIQKYCSGEVSSPIIDIYKNKINDNTFKIRIDRIHKLIGQKIDKNEIF